MTFISILFITTALSVYGLRANYRGELAISFLPYRAVLALLGLIFSLVRLATLLYYKPQKIWFFTQYAACFVIGFGLVFLLFSQKFRDFYGHSLTTTPATQSLSILYSNIYKNNRNYPDILEHIKNNNPDIVLFVEFDEEHRSTLKPLLNKDYPYIIKGSENTSLIASKHPLTPLPLNSEPTPRNYENFLLKTPNQNYRIYLIHTTSPTSENHFHKRNYQLEFLAHNFLEDDKWAPSDEKVVMIWDFNVSPRSLYYEKFAQEINGKLINATQNFPILFTRDLSKLLDISGQLKLPRFLFSHIDQVFISPNTKLEKIETIQLQGSDHSGFLLHIE